MMLLKYIRDSVFPNANWISDVLNVASNIDTNWVWGCRILCKKKFHNQRTKDSFKILFSLNYAGPMTYLLRKDHGPSYLKTRPLSTLLQTARGLLHKKKGALSSVSPQKKEASSLGVSASALSGHPQQTGTDIQSITSLCTSVSSRGSPHRRWCHKRFQNRRPKNGYHDGSF